ncbi:AcrR family transcriptional regulator [Aequitasia blattaphilus]|uniref:TetR/AcrR family transcriptional regulator n=1 Tax=Aequitasia blattaphilus TaxID=2949332 RepID=A0ABT1EBL8_9FIRM|nr:TetR/AcrR family transcriptional regulator [Aequitasia blattaphilus]MCP1103228.1 TetR/AcrR family transcriptional regulator [Aequitasia blattaphilus]MCR8615868.1 TetR/AcrR family transcriptional regulator [Aequitasia blattaphilus]
MPYLFSEEDRKRVREEMLKIGFELIREHGMTHASVEKVTKAAGLGRTTFYNFFPSKEYFVYEIAVSMRMKLMAHFEELLDGRDKLPIAQAQDFFKEIIFNEDSIYQYLTPEDKEKLRAELPPECFLDIDGEANVMNYLFRHMENVRPDLDEHLIGNLLKIMALTQINKAELHTDALNRTLDQLYDLLFSNIFKKEGMQCNL